MSVFKPEIIANWQKLKPEIVQAEALLRERFATLFLGVGIPIHSIESRIKSDQSLTQKLSRPDRTYAQLWDVTDLLGFRIVTPFEDSIQAIAKVIEKNFRLDLHHSQNKLHFRDHERFGYRSLHYVCEFPNDEKNRGLPTEARFEIQLRTSLQNVWAEIEHDLGYKADEVASPILRRRFSRLSSLFEIADEELVAIKKELNDYVLNRQVGEDPKLDHVTLGDLTKHPEIEKLDQRIAAHLGRTTSEHHFFPDYNLRALAAADLDTVQKTLSAFTATAASLESFIPLYFEFAKAALGFDVSQLEEIQKGYGLLFLAHLHLLKTESLALNRMQRFARFYETLDFPGDFAKSRDIASQLVKQTEGLKF
jgi:putative GTP pyrophosphokinase